eukprot:10616282-Lingulodinium_polyedra.AAC.1
MRQVAEAEATAEWRHSRCQACRGQRRLLVARRDFPSGAEVIVPAGTDGNLALAGPEPAVMVTFDGGLCT